MRARVKICGITRVEDALAATRFGVDAIGLMFYAESPRAVSPEQARRITAALPPFVSTVGLFVDASSQDVMEISAMLGLSVLQFHGEETPAYCHQFATPYIKAVRMQPDINLHDIAARYHRAQGLLLDAYVEGVQGGTGKAFDWTRIPHDLDKPIILAGGLDATNVIEAIQTVNPYAVDVSTGVETAKGIKDVEKMAAFLNNVNNFKDSTPT